MFQVYGALEDLVDTLSRRAGHEAYIFESSASNIKKLLNLVVRTVLAGAPAHDQGV